MRLINKKYEIVKKINDNRGLVEYVVIDVVSRNKYILNICNNEIMNLNIRNYICKNFKSMKNLNCEGIYNIYSLITIKEIDGVILDQKQYGYLSEFIEGYIELNEFIQRCNKAEKIDIFMNIATYLNTLNRKGYIYKDTPLIKLKRNEEKGVNIKFSNILFSEMKYLEKYSLEKYSSDFRENIVLGEKVSNIYELLKIYKGIFLKSGIDKELDKIINDQINDRYNVDSFYNIDELISFINIKLAKEFPKFHYDSLNKIIKDVDVAGRSIEIDNIIKMFKNNKGGKFKSKFNIYNGVLGIGKTNFLREIKERLQFVYNIPVLEIPKREKIDKLNKSKEVLITEVRKILNIDCSEEVNKFIQNLRREDEDYTLEETRLNYRIMNNGVKLLEKFTKISPIVILIDNLEKHNMFLKMYVKHIASNLNKIDNVIVISTIESYERDTELESMVDSLKTEIDISEYKLDLFNEYYTRDMVSKMLNSNKVDSISKTIHQESLGNPGMIEERIEYLFSKGNLYVSRDDGYWKNEIEKVNASLPKRFEVDYKHKLNVMEEDEFYILKRLSTFNFPISEELIINDIIPKSESNMYAFYRVKDANILIQSFTDRGVTIGFKDYFYKRMIYKNVKDEERIKYHKLNLEALEKIEKGDNYYIEEIIYQLEQGKQYEKMLQKGHEYGDKLSKEGEEEKAVEAYKSIIEYTNGEEKCILSYKIASLYRKVESYNEAYHYYESSNNIAKDIRNFEIEIKSSIFMAYIQIEKRKFEKVSILLNEIKAKLAKNDYILGEAYVFYLKALYMYKLGLKDEAVDAASKGLSIAKAQGFELIKGRLYAFLFKFNIENELYNKTLKDAEYCLDIFRKNGDWKEYLNALINIGVYLVEVEDKLEEAEIIFKDVLKHGKLRNILRVQFKSLINLSHISIIKMEYEIAENYAKEAINLIKSSKKLENYILVAYWNLIYILGLQGKTVSMIKLKNMIDGQEDMDKITNKYVLDLNIVKASYYYFLDDYEMCIKEISKFNLNKTNNILSNRMFINSAKIMSLYGVDSNEEIIKIIDDLIENKELKMEFKTILFTEAMIYLYKIGKEELAKDIINNLDIINCLDITAICESKYVQMQFIYRDYQLNTLINRGFRIIGTTKSDIDKININYMIGNGYEKIRCYVKSIYYYYESLCMIIKQIKIISEDNKLRYINSSSFINVYKIFINCLKDNFQINIENNGFKEFTSVEEYEYFVEKISANNLLNIDKFRDIVVRDYQNTYYNYNNNISDVLNSFSDNILNNIELILKYIANKTLATSAVITYNDNNGENKILVSYRIKEEKYLEKRLNNNISLDEFIVNEDRIIKNEFAREILSDDVKACLYSSIKSKKVNNIQNKKSVGQLLVLADKAINNINSSSREEIKELESLLIFLIQQYKINLDSTRDKLTGAYNRAYFEKAHEDIIDYSSYKNTLYSLVIFDIDNFKGVNDEYGHPVGDIVLKSISDIVKANISKEDIFCRYGGEEFILILPLKDEKVAEKQAELIRSKIDEADILKGKRPLTISLGVATYKIHSKNKSELVKRADEALYEAKKRGKNRVKVWDAEFSKQSDYNDKLAGVLTGNSARDYDKVASILEIVSLAKRKNDKIQKIYEILKAIILKTDSTEGYMFFVEHDRILNMKRVEKDGDGWSNIGYFNKDIIKKVRNSREGIYTIDWEEIKEIGSLETIPKWHSICVIPLINGEKLKGILYLSVPTHIKEFDFNDFNYATTLSEILSILL